MQLIAIDLDWELNEAGIALDDAFKFILFCEILVFVLQGENDACTTAFAFDLFDFVGAVALARPAKALAFELPCAGVYFDGVCDHKDGVEADAELTNQVFIALSAFFEGG